MLEKSDRKAEKFDEAERLVVKYFLREETCSWPDDHDYGPIRKAGWIPGKVSVMNLLGQVGGVT